MSPTLKITWIDVAKCQGVLTQECLEKSESLFLEQMAFLLDLNDAMFQLANGRMLAAAAIYEMLRKRDYEPREDWTYRPEDFVGEM